MGGGHAQGAPLTRGDAMGIEDIVDKAKSALEGHEDLIDKAADAIKSRTDDKTDTQIDSLVEKAHGFIGDDKA